MVRFYLVLNSILTVTQTPPYLMCLRPSEKDPDHPLDLDGRLESGEIHYILPFNH